MALVGILTSVDGLKSYLYPRALAAWEQVLQDKEQSLGFNLDSDKDLAKRYSEVLRIWRLHNLNKKINAFFYVYSVVYLGNQDTLIKYENKTNPNIVSIWRGRKLFEK